MKAVKHMFLLLCPLALLSGTAYACQSCLLDLASRGTFREIGESAIDGRTEKRAVVHASVLPIGLTSRNRLGTIMKSLDTNSVHRSAFSILLVRKFIAMNNNNEEMDQIMIHKPERNAEYFRLLQHKMKRIMHSESDKSDKKADSEEEKSKPEEEEIMSSSMIMAIGFYKQFISPLLPPACRFLPTCSQYGVQAIKEFGPTKGVILTAWRLARCSPLGGKGTHQF